MNWLCFSGKSTDGRRCLVFLNGKKGIWWLLNNILMNVMFPTRIKERELAWSVRWQKLLTVSSVDVIPSKKVPAPSSGNLRPLPIISLLFLIVPSTICSLYQSPRATLSHAAIFNHILILATVHPDGGAEVSQPGIRPRMLKTLIG